jgi:hypothetical protein
LEKRYLSRDSILNFVLVLVIVLVLELERSRSRLLGRR